MDKDNFNVKLKTKGITFPKSTVKVNFKEIAVNVSANP